MSERRGAALVSSMLRRDHVFCGGLEAGRSIKGRVKAPLRRQTSRRLVAFCLLGPNQTRTYASTSQTVTCI